MPSRLTIAAFTIILTITSAAGAAERVYRIGNSLTWDSQPKAIEALAALRGWNHVEAYHINCGKSLQRIWTHPQEVCVKVVEPYGAFGQALPEFEWDAVTLQPHPGANATLGSDTARILDFIAKTQSQGRNMQTVFYIYAAWPGQQHGPFHEVWLQETPDADDTPSMQTQTYFTHLLRRVRAATQAEVHIIPVGHVLFELDRQMRAGVLEGYTQAYDLYRDRVHLNHVGRYAAGVTVLSTLYHKNPAGLGCPEGHYGGGNDLTPQLYEAIHTAVWKVVQHTTKP